MALTQDLGTQTCSEVRKDVLQGMNESMLAALVMLPAVSGDLFQVSYSIVRGALGKLFARTWPREPMLSVLAEQLTS